MQRESEASHQGRDSGEESSVDGKLSTASGDSSEQGDEDADVISACYGAEENESSSDSEGKGNGDECDALDEVEGCQADEGCESEGAAAEGYEAYEGCEPEGYGADEGCEPEGYAADESQKPEGCKGGGGMPCGSYVLGEDVDERELDED